MMLQPPLAYMYEQFPNLYGETLVISYDRSQICLEGHRPGER